MTLATRQIRFTPLIADGSGAPSVMTGYYTIAPTAAYDDGVGRVEPLPFQVDIDGVAGVVDLAVTPTDNAWAWKVLGFFPYGGTVYTTSEIVAVPAGTYATVLDFEDLTRLTSTGGVVTPTVPSTIEARIAALEAAVAAGVITGGAPAGTGTAGRIKVSDLFDVSSIGISLGTAASTAAAKTAIGLGNVDNTSDVNKPVSTAQQTALNLKANVGDLAIASADMPFISMAVAGAYAGRPATVRVGLFLGSVPPTNDGALSGGGGMVPSYDLWFRVP